MVIGFGGRKGGGGDCFLTLPPALPPFDHHLPRARPAALPPSLLPSFGGVVLLFFLGSNLGGVGPERGLRGGGRRGGVRSGPGAARTILLFHIISARPSEQPLMVRTFLKVYMELGSYFLFLQEQIKDIIINAGEREIV